MTGIPEPEASYRCWNFTYRRPRRMGWPLLTRTGYPPANKPDALLEPRTITVQVRQHGAAQAPELSSVSVAGKWAKSGVDATSKIETDARPGLAFVIYAPDWVRELAADAVDRAVLEVAAATEARMP